MSLAEKDWYRLSGLALVFIILNGLQKQIRENLFLFAGAGAGAAFTDWLGLREFLLLILLFVLISVLGGMVYHRRFRFRLEADAVRVRRGLFEQKELRIRYARVQNIQLGEPFYFRPFGLVRFSLQTPGAAEKEVELPGIPRDLAWAMRDRISQFHEGPDSSSQTQVAADAVPEWVYRANNAQLFLHGLSSNQVWVLAGLFLYLGSNLLEWVAERFEAAVAQASDAIAWGWWWAPGLLLVLLGTLFGLSGLLAILRFHDYRLSDLGERLVAVAGLLDRREQTIRRPKLTGVMLRQSAVGRLIGCWSLTAHQTQSGTGLEATDKSTFLVPGLRAADLSLSAILLKGATLPEAFAGVSPRFRQFAWSRVLLGLLLVLCVLALLLGRDHWSLLLVALLAAVALPLLHWRFRRWGWALQDDRILWIRRGLLGQRLDAFDLERVQQASITTSPYLRRHALARLNLVLPHGPIRVPFLPQELASSLVNRAIYAAETARLHEV